jgi:hypothetical protein
MLSTLMWSPHDLYTLMWSLCDGVRAGSEWQQDQVCEMKKLGLGAQW